MSNTEPLPIYVGMSLWRAERILIGATLEHSGWRVSKTANILGIDRSTLYAKIVKYGLERHGAGIAQAATGDPKILVPDGDRLHQD
jgi:DNA-binding NtrC family response regulator